MASILCCRRGESPLPRGGRVATFVSVAGASGHLAGVIQLVECQLPKLDVAGSSPVARSDVNANGGLLREAAVFVARRRLTVTESCLRNLRTTCRFGE